MFIFIIFVFDIFLDKVEAIIINHSRDSTDGKLENDWFLETVKVFDSNDELEAVFPLYRWIPNKKEVKFHNYDSFLPNDDPEKSQRQDELSARAEEYKFGKDQHDLPRAVYFLKILSFVNSLISIIS